MGVLMGEGVAMMGVVGLWVNVRISSSCTAFLLSTNGDATAVTGVMGRCGKECSPCEEEMIGIGALMGEGEGDSRWEVSRGSLLDGCLMGVMFDVPACSLSPAFACAESIPPNPIARISANTFSSFPALPVSALLLLLLFVAVIAFVLCERLRPGLPGLAFGGGSFSSFPPRSRSRSLSRSRSPFPPALASGSGFSSALGMLSLFGRNQRIVEGMWMVGVCELNRAAGVYCMLPVGVEGAGEWLPKAAGGRGAGDALSIDAIEDRGGGVDAVGAGEGAGAGVRGFCVFKQIKET